MIELSITLAEGSEIEYNNSDVPVTLSIPYQSSAAELKLHEHITIWYLDHSGHVIYLPNGKYDAVTGKVTFGTTHFSQYAVMFGQKSFDDLDKVTWAKREIEVLASKGLIQGTTTTTFLRVKIINEEISLSCL